MATYPLDQWNVKCYNWEIFLINRGCMKKTLSLLIVLHLGIIFCSSEDQNNKLKSNYIPGGAHPGTMATLAVTNLVLSTRFLAQGLRKIPGNKPTALLQAVGLMGGFTGLVITRSFTFKNSQEYPKIPSFQEKMNYTLSILGDTSLDAAIGVAILGTLGIVPLRIAKVCKILSSKSTLKDVLKVGYVANSISNMMLYNNVSTHLAKFHDDRNVVDMWIEAFNEGLNNSKQENKNKKD